MRFREGFSGRCSSGLGRGCSLEVQGGVLREGFFGFREGLFGKVCVGGEPGVCVGGEGMGEEGSLVAQAAEG